MRLLSRSVWCCWVCGVACGACAVLTYDAGRHFHWIFFVKVLGDTLSLVGCTTCLLYVSTAFRALWYPSREGRRAHLMICLFMMSYAATLLPWLMEIAGIIESTVLGNISDCLLSLNGVANVLVYALSQRLARGRVWSLNEEGADGDFVEWAGEANVRVGFDFREHEEHAISRVQRQALRQSERDIQAAGSAAR